MSDVSVTGWNKRARDAERKMLDLHEKLDRALAPGGSTADLVSLSLSKEEVAMLMVAIEQNL